MPPSSRPPESSSPARRERRRRAHQRVDSQGDYYQQQPAAPPSPRRPQRQRRGSTFAYESEHDEQEQDEVEEEVYYSPGSPSKTRPKGRPPPISREERQHRERRSSRQRPSSRSRAPGGGDTRQKSRSASTGLSSARLAELDRFNERQQQNSHNNHRDEWTDPPSRPAAATTSRRTAAAREQRRECLRNNDDGYDDHAYDDGNNDNSDFRERERERKKLEHRERKRRQRKDEQRAAEKKAAAMAAALDDGPGYQPLPSSSKRRERREASGQVLERGSEYYSEKQTLRDEVRGRNGSRISGEDDEYARKKKRKRNLFIGIGIAILLLVIIIPVAVVTSKNSSGNSGSGSGSQQPQNGNLQGISPSSIPKWAQGGYLDPFDWYTTLDFNVTFTDQTVGGLYVMGLNSTWNDDTQANPDVPKLNEKWEYGTVQMRGMNLGGWLSVEPFIAPSLFSGFDTSQGIVDEWTLSSALGPTEAKSTLEQHYATWVSEQTFEDIAAAGFDHVRIPYSYWAVKTYEGDPYVPLVSWRYLLRGIEWARKYGLRINLDLHGLPGSQNGMNHSGHQGYIGWLNGTNGTLNGDRAIEIHDQLTQFFTQARYENIIALYGLANEPRMTFLDPTTVIDWSQRGINTARANGYQGLIVVGDGFYGLNKWQGQLQDPNVVLDAHQYVIFNPQQIIYNHSEKVDYACAGWTAQAKESMNTNTGFGPTIFGEWSQADTDCATYLNNVGVGSRWEGTLNLLDAPGGLEVGASIDSVLTPTCPTNNNPRCDCTPANADPSTYSAEYKQWLMQFAEAQMYSFEFGWGWYYWTWKTESATQWSYQAALAAGIVPPNARVRSWNCTQPIPNYDALGLPESY